MPARIFAGISVIPDDTAKQLKLAATEALPIFARHTLARAGRDQWAQGRIFVRRDIDIIGLRIRQTKVAPTANDR